MFDSLVQDVRYGARVLFKRRLFTAVAVATLALGIGVNTAIFSVVNAVLLAPLPYEKFADLIVIWKSTLPNKTDQLPDSIPNFIDLREQNHVFEQIAAIRPQQFILTDG